MNPESGTSSTDEVRKIIIDQLTIERNKQNEDQLLNEKKHQEKLQDEQRELQRLCLVEYKSQSYASFYNTTMEKDKSILTLSVAGIGFLITVIQLFKTINYLQLTLVAISAFFYLVSIICIIRIFSKNAPYIVGIVNDDDVSSLGHKLKTLDSTAIKSFFIGIILSIILGGTTITSKLEARDMSDDKNTTNKVSTIFTDTESRSGSDQLSNTNESYALAAQIKSALGASAMNPSSQQHSTTRNTVSQPTGSSAQDMKPKA